MTRSRVLSQLELENSVRPLRERSEPMKKERKHFTPEEKVAILSGIFGQGAYPQYVTAITDIE